MELVGKPGRQSRDQHPRLLPQPSALSAGVYLPLLDQRLGKVCGVRELRGGIKSLLQTSILSLGATVLIQTLFGRKIAMAQAQNP